MTNPSGPYNPGPGPGPAGGYGPGPQVPPRQHGTGGWQQPRPMPPEKGLMGALLDTRFNHLVTPRLITFWYVVALLLIGLQCLFFIALGLWLLSVRDGGWAFLIMIIMTPIGCLFEALTVRIVMEAVVVRFKGVEHLRVIKDKL